MTATAIRYHFPETEDLLHALVDPFLDDLETTMSKHPEYPSWPDGVADLARSFLDALVDHRDTALLVHHDPYLIDHESFGGRLLRATRRMRDALSGPNPSSAAIAAGVAAVGGMWRPIQVLPMEEVRNNYDSILSVILSGHPTET